MTRIKERLIVVINDREHPYRIENGPTYAKLTESDSFQKTKVDGTDQGEWRQQNVNNRFDQSKYGFDEFFHDER